MSDIVEKLTTAEEQYEDEGHREFAIQTRDCRLEIKRLRKKCEEFAMAALANKEDAERLRAALMEIADLRYECGDSECGAEHIARRALGGKDE